MRPSHVLGGQNMIIAYRDEDIEGTSSSPQAG
ncbi:MAG: hypothetical protein ACLRSY_05640 [Acutalibacter sp.]